MSDEKIENTVTVKEPAAAPEPTKLATREDLNKEGWSPAEIESAQKRGMIADPKEEVKKEEPKKEEPQVEEPPKPEPEKPKPISGIPDVDLSSEQEEVFLKTFGPGTTPRALYFRMKNERKKRQDAENHNRLLAAENEALKRQPVKPAEDPDPTAGDPEDKPLTLKDLKQLREAELNAATEHRTKMDERTVVVANAQKEQEEFAKSVYADFDEVTTKALDLAKNLDKMITDPLKKAKAINLIRQLQVAAANADKYGIEDYNGAMISYELGQMHPEHGKKLEPTPEPGGKKLTPEKLKQISERRPSSASVNGGSGTRTVSSEDVTAEMLNGMNAKERWEFRKKYPAQYDKLVKA